MLKGIPSILTPDLLKIMMEMGHGDELVIGDGNFPGASNTGRLVRCDGHAACDVLDAVLQLFPLDTFTEQPVALMAVVPGDDYTPEIWEEYRRIIAKYDSRRLKFDQVERFAFYERTKKAYAVVATGERQRYANVILRKGIVGD